MTTTPAAAAVAIRTATVADHAAVVRLFQSQLGESFALEPKLWDEVCQSDVHRALVAEEDGQIVGIAVVVVSDRIHLAAGTHRRRFHLDQVLVAPDQRRRGIGRALIDHVIEMAKASRPSYIIVNCDFTDVAARRAYESAGMYLVRQSSDRFEIAFP